MKTINVKFVCSIGFSGAEHEEIYEYEVSDDFVCSQENINRLVKGDFDTWVENFRDDNFYLVDEDEEEIEYEIEN